MIKSYNKGKDKKVMIWACFKDKSQKSDLIFMFNDSDSKREEITSAVYLKVIEEQLSTLWEPDLIFMHDNAKIHTAHKIRDWLAKAEIVIIEWSSYSPDLNPIEHV